MGRSQLLVCGFAALSLATASLCAQGPFYRERWADLHLELLRERIVKECSGRDDDTVRTVANLLVNVDDSIPFRPAAHALARLRGVPCDDAFLLRCTVGAYVLPEVVDPEASKEECRSLHVTVLLPYVVPLPKDVRFDLEVFDSAGARQFAMDFGAGQAIEDLRMGHVHVEAPAKDLADGTYVARLSVLVDGKGPSANDYVVEHAFSVLRGYQQRSEAAQGKILAVEKQLMPTDRALLHGLLLEVSRAYAGEAFDGASDAVADLVRAEKALANLAAEKPLLDGLETLLPTALPTGGDQTLPAVVRWPVRKEADAKLPLVCVLAGAPSLDPRGRRPSAPDARSGRWLYRRVGDFGLGAEWPIAWVQSQTQSAPFAKSLPSAVAALHERMPTDGTTIFVAELESAVALCFADSLLASARGVVLCGAGALAKPQLERIAKLPILGIPLTGHPSSSSLQFTSFTADRLREAGVECGYRIAPERPRPWIGGLSVARAEVAQFVRSVTAAK
ncbi:MAG: hypothetical protein RLZZ562_3271 [Planctomycetota bacterium]|jgi:hypothetical protein